MGGALPKGKNHGRENHPKITEVRISESEITEARKRHEIVTLLLYGSGESGKSTIFKQMVIIHGNGFGDDHRRELRNRILFNVLEGAAVVCKAMEDAGTPLENIGAANMIINRYEAYRNMPSGAMDTNVADTILEMLNDPNFIKTVSQGTHTKLQDNWLKLANNLKDYPDRWGGDSWVPTNEDILTCRIRTTGVVSDKFFKIDKTIYRFIDVGGQRSERGKHVGKMFQDVTAILYVSSLSEYNLHLFESPTEWRLVDSLHMWNNTTNSTVFKKSAMLLFLNKVDLFREKFYDLEIPFPTDLPGIENTPTKDQQTDRDCNEALVWFETLYRSHAAETKRDNIYIHRTTAVDTNLMETVISDVSVHVMTQIFGVAGLLAPKS